MERIMDYNIQIAGFATIVNDVMDLRRKISEISNDNNCTIQLLNADGIAGKEHILHTTIHAIKAFRRDENIANNLGLEICVRTSTQRQITKALDLLGIKPGEMNICAVILNCDETILLKLEEIIGNRDDQVLESDDNKLTQLYGISDVEYETAGNITRILMERTALLILET